MTANSEAAEAGEAKEDATLAGKNAEMKAEAEQLKNEVWIRPPSPPCSPGPLSLFFHFPSFPVPRISLALSHLPSKFPPEPPPSLGYSLLLLVLRPTCLCIDVHVHTHMRTCTALLLPCAQPLRLAADDFSCTPPSVRVGCL